MTKLIDAAALKDSVEYITWYHITDKGKMVEGSTSEYVSFYRREDVIAAIDNAPTVDAVPVVRCKDCTGGGGMCGFFGQNDYCSYGEKAGELYHDE